MRTLLKNCAFIFSAILVSPITLLCLILGWSTNRDQAIVSFSQALSIVPGKLAVYLRAGFYRFTLRRCSPDAVISFLVLFSQHDIEIEEGVYIGPQSNIGRCRIGKNCLLGSGVHIMSGKGQHNFGNINEPIKDQGGQFTKMIIGQNCWIGNGAMIMANIGANCIIGAGSVVTSNVPNNAIVAGNPAKIIKIR